jgi:hypothetical protein
MKGTDMNIFQEVKAAVTTRQAAEYYGYRVSRNGMMCCPFHSDKTPSMKVDRNFICFGCQEKGDVIHFTGKLYNITPLEAAKKLAEDFNLDITSSRPDGPKGTIHHDRRGRQAKKPRSDLHKERQFQSAVSRVYHTFCDYLHLLHRWRREYAPSSPNEDYHPLFVEAMQKTEFVNELLDELMEGSPEEKAAVIIEKGKEIKSIEARIDEYRSGEEGRTGSCAGSDGRPAFDRGN